MFSQASHAVPLISSTVRGLKFGHHILATAGSWLHVLTLSTILPITMIVITVARLCVDIEGVTKLGTLYPRYACEWKPVLVDNDLLFRFPLISIHFNGVNVFRFHLMLYQQVPGNSQQNALKMSMKQDGNGFLTFTTVSPCGRDRAVLVVFSENIVSG